MQTISTTQTTPTIHEIEVELADDDDDDNDDSVVPDDCITIRIEMSHTTVAM